MVAATPARDEAMTAMVQDTMPFARLLGLEVVEAGPARVVTTAGWAPERCTAGGRLHGGFLMAAADSTAATCAFLNLPPGAEGVTSIEFKVNFFAGVRSGSVTITAEPVHVGRATVVVQTDVRDDQGELVSRSLQTQAVLYPRPAAAGER